MDKKVNIAIFASGEGTNAENIIQYFQKYRDTEVSCIITNKEDAGVIKRTRRYRIPRYINSQYKEIDQILTKHNIHYIILAGWLDKIPVNFCKKYEYKIINIHPSLLPKYGGKGMYGDTVHKNVKKNKEEETGITIHFINEEYDKGTVLFRKKIKIFPEDTWQDIKSKAQDLEQKFYPKIIENTIKGTYEYLYEKNKPIRT